MMTIVGEIKYSKKVEVDIEQIARSCCKQVGFDHIDKGLDYKSMTVITQVDIIQN